MIRLMIALFFLIGVISTIAEGGLGAPGVFSGFIVIILLLSSVSKSAEKNKLRKEQLKYFEDENKERDLAKYEEANKQFKEYMTLKWEKEAKEKNMSVNDLVGIVTKEDAMNRLLTPLTDGQQNNSGTLTIPEMTRTKGRACPNCGKICKSKAIFCDSCGSRLSTDKKQIAEENAKLEEDAKKEKELKQSMIALLGVLIFFIIMLKMSMPGY